MQIDILTIFPDFFTGPFTHGILSRAIQVGQVQVRTHDLRAFTHDRHRTVDDRPFGGGEGMVLKPEPIFDCLDTLGLAPKSERDTARETVILLSAQGRPFTEAIAQELAATERLVFLCGRYEGVDERVNELACDRELSIGDYVLSGGELAAAVIVDAVVRLLPGALGNPDSARFESFGAADPGASHTAGEVPSSTHGSGGLLDYPHYTRPAVFRGEEVPRPLQGGNHTEIRQWRRQQALRKTLANRPDLLEKAALSHQDLAYLAALPGHKWLQFEGPRAALAAWERVRQHYARYGAHPAMLVLATSIADSRFAPHLYAWTSHDDLCLQQTPVTPYSGPYLRISPIAQERLEFRYVDTRTEQRQWKRTVPNEEGFARFKLLLEHLHWFPSEPNR